MSLICGSLTWLEHHETEKKAQIEKELDQLNLSADPEDKPINPDEPSWFSEAKKNVAANRRKNELKEELKKIIIYEEKITKLRERAKVIKHSLSSTENSFEQKLEFTKNKGKKKGFDIAQEDEDVLISDVKSDDEDSNIEELSEEMVIFDNLKPIYYKIFQNFDFSQEEGTKIIFASRTHSQISQFVREVEKSPFGKQIRVCTLASRQQMCINEAVTQLKNSNLINEK